MPVSKTQAPEESNVVVLFVLLPYVAVIFVVQKSANGPSESNGLIVMNHDVQTRTETVSRFSEVRTHI